jgi:hypothetical protein
MSGPELFPYFWLGMVMIFGLVSVAWGVNDLRRGSARLGQWSSSRVNRDEEPFEFWLAVLGKFGGGIVASFMFYFGLDMLRW